MILNKERYKIKQWPLAPNSREWQISLKLLVRMWRGESHFSQKWRLANVGKSGEYSVNGLANVGEFGESAQHGSANVGEFGESTQHGLANVGESGESAQHGSAQAGMIR